MFYRPCLEALETRVLLSTVRWTNAAGGDWGVATNWDTGHVPGSGDDAVIDLAGVSVTHSSGNDTVGSLTVSGATFTLSAGTFTSTLKGTGTINLAGGTLDQSVIAAGTTVRSTGAGTLRNSTVNGTLDLASDSGTIVSVTDGLTINGTVLVGDTAGGSYGSVRFNNTLTVAGTGSIAFGGSPSNALVSYVTSITVTFGPNLTVHGKNGSLGLSGGDTYINQGTIAADTAGGTISVSFGASGSNTGMLQAVNGGALTIDGTWSNSGTLQAASGSTLNLQGTGSTTSPLIAAAGGTVSLGAQLNNTGSTLTLSGPGTFNLAGGTINGGTVVEASGAQLIGTVDGGTLDGVTLNGNLDLMSNNQARVSLTDGLVLHGTIFVGNSAGTTWGTVAFTNTETIDGSSGMPGTVLFGDTGDNALLLTGYLVSIAVTVGPNFTIHGKSGLIGVVSGVLNPRIINQGTIAADTAGGTISVSLGISAANAISSNTGTLEAVNGGTLTVDALWNNSGTLQAASGSTLNLGGTGSSTSPLIAAAGGTVNLEDQLNNTGSTLTLSGPGSFNLAGGTINGGTVVEASGAQLIGTADVETLDGVTLNGNLDLMTNNEAQINVADGLVLHGTIFVGNSSGSTYGKMFYTTTETIDGSPGMPGTIVLGGSSNLLSLSNTAMSLTYGPNLIVHGSSGTLSSLSSAANSSFLNEGSISADVAGGSMSFIGPNWTNSGTITLYGGNINASLTGTNPVFTNTGSLIVHAGTFSLGGASLMTNGSGTVVVQPQGIISIGGNFGGLTTNASSFVLAGTVLLNGLGTAAAPQLLEVMSQDLGNVAAGFNHNFAHGTLALGFGTYVQLVDNSHNSQGTGPESLYANSLVVPSGSTLDLKTFHAYARGPQLNGTIAGGNIAILPTAGPLISGISAPGSIASDTQVDNWTFFGRAGMAVSVIVNTGNGGTPPPLQPPLNFANVRLLDPNGNVLASGSNSQSGASVSLLGVSLPADGTYKIQIRPGQAGSKGFYGVTWWDATPHVGPLNLNQSVMGAIDTPFRVERWQFSAGAGDQVKFDLISASTSGIQFDLTGPNGYVGFSGLSASSDIISLPSSGNYVLTAHGTGSLTGAYAFDMRLVSQIHLTLGMPYSGNWAGSGQFEVFRVDVPQAEQLLVSFQDSSAADHNEVYLKFGASPTRADYQYRFSAAASANQVVPVPSAAPGTWYVLVYGDLVPSPSSYTLLAQASSVFLNSVTPDHAGNGADLTLTLRGAGFDNTTTVSLVSGSGTTYPAGTASADLPTQMTATFPAGSVPAGVYSVKISQSSGATATLSNAFTMTQGGKANFQASLELPSNVGARTVATLYVDFSNVGDLAMPAPLLVVNATNDGNPGALMTLDHSRVIPGLWTSAFPDGYSNSIQILAGGTDPGVLQPGESERIPVYYAGWLGTLNPHIGILFTLSVLQADNTSPIDWASLKNGLRPDSIGPDAWNAVFANLSAQIGTTWGNYVARLDDNASYLARLGETVTDVSRLWGFEIQEANGFSPLPQMASAEDAQVTAPGLNINFDRSFYPAITGRFQSGRFGWGWFDNWQSSLSVRSDGTVIVFGPAGAERRFQPDSRNPSNYFAQPGDHGDLAPATGGFTLRETDGLVTSFGGDGTLSYIQDLNGNRITAGYSNGLLTSLTHSSGQTLQIAYNSAGHIDHITDPVSGRTTTYTYDSTNQYLLSVQDLDGRVTHYTYDQGTNPVTMHALLSVTYPDGSHDYFGYDPSGRLNDYHRDGGAEEVTYTYGPAGTVAATDAAGYTTTSYLDYRGLLVKEANPLNHAVDFAYDNNLKLVQLTDPAGNNSSFAYDANGNLIHASDPLGQTSRFIYAVPYNRLTAMIDPNGNTTQYGYDPKGNLQSITYADGSVESWIHDPLGNPTTWTNRRGHAVKYSYDSSGRLISQTFADGSQLSYTYDPVTGNLTQTTDPAGTTSYKFDDLQHPQRLTRILYPDGKFLQFQYDSAGRRQQLVDQDGLTTVYTYDSVGRLQSLVDGQGNLIVRYTYDTVGRLHMENKGNGTYTNYDYTESGQVKHVINYAPTGTVNSRFDYTYDALGHVATMSTLDGQWTYSYDPTGQLIHAVFASNNPGTLPNQDLQYFYDAAGNRTRTVINGVTTLYVSNNLNQYLSVGSAHYTFDPDGNLISVTDSSGSTTYTYNDANELTAMTTPTGTSSYQYNGFGNRIAAVQKGQRVSYLIDPFGLGDVIGEYDSAGKPIAHYTYGLGTTSQFTSTNGQTFFDFDALGSTVGLTDQTGKYLDNYGYLPFGAMQYSTEVVRTPFNFGGEFGVRFDGSGQYSMHLRDYSTSLGRFLAQDGTGLGAGINLYSYVDNNPNNYVDPTGRFLELSALKELVIPALKAFLASGEPVGAFQKSFAAAQNTANGLDLGTQVVSKARSPLFDNETRYFAPQLTFGYYAYSFHTGTYQTDILLIWSAKLLDIVNPFSLTQDLIDIADAIQAFFPGNSNPPNSSALTGLTQQSAQLRLSADPNDKLGPAGFGPANFSAGDKVFPYRIDFENDATATAPAQRVDISDQLDPHLDWNTFLLTEIGFGDVNLSIPAGSQYYETVVPMTYNGKTFQVEIEAGIRAATGQVFAIFLSIDPNTSLPPDVLTGFLPPEDGTGRGQGHISYTIRPKSGLPTGTQIRNVALVTFDLGETIATDQVAPHDPSQGIDPSKQTLITIDAGTPTSSVSPLPANTATQSFTVSWSGQDDAGGSGIAYYDIYVQDNNGPFTLWLGQTTQTSATFTGILGHRYGFYSVATDNVGNREATPTTAQASTLLGSTGLVVTTPSNQTGVEGSSMSFNLGSFSDTAAGPWSVTVKWGDGTANTTFSATATGTINAQSHTYAEEGSYTVTVLVANSTLSVSGSFTIAMSDLAVTGTASNISATAGAPFTGSLATFTDPAGAEPNAGDPTPNAISAHYTATIDWGDKSATTIGTITLSGNTFTLSGSHAYAAAGSYTVTVTINHESIMTTLQGTATVASLGQFVPAQMVKPISFWEGIQGQQLIRRFGVTSNGLTLGQWLATTFSNLYGGKNGAPDLSPFTNAQIASYYQSLFLASKGTGLDAEVLATALEVFTTTASLGGSAGQSYGFTVTDAGLGAYSWNIAASGQAFGVSNLTVLDAYQILLAANNAALGGEPWGSNTVLRNEALSVFRAINGG